MNDTTFPKIRKNTAAYTWLILIVGIMCIFLILSTIFPIFPAKITPPNQELIKYLENQRQQILKDNQEIKALISFNNKAAAERQHIDSLTDLLTQNRLIQSLNELINHHEKNTYVYSLSRDSLRRAYHDFQP